MKKEVKIVIAICSIIVITILLISIYSFFIVNPMTIEPEVRVTNFNYNANNTSATFWNPPIWIKFSEEYPGKYSERLRDEIVASMKKQAEDLGEDPKLLKDCIYACGEFDEPEYHPSLPCLAEKAKFNNTDVWIIVFLWGFSSEDLGHIRYFVVDISSLEILQFETCG